MNGQPNRLPSEGEHRFKGAAIDRQRPLRFRLDGRLVHGYAGDTVLSAALASGIIGAGMRAGQPLALDERFAPAVRLARRGRGAAEALPMARTPAIEGVDLVTTGAGAPGRFRHGWRRLTAGLLQSGGRLAVGYNQKGSAAPWVDVVASARLSADLAVIGGGLAGMSAALEAARHGQRIILVERRPSLGGNAGFFGATGDEEAPEATIDRLRTAIANALNITVLLRAEAFALSNGVVQLHQIVVENGVPVGRVLAIEAPRIVVATGVVERLPVFAGNRRPGVVGSLEAYERAAQFGVWIGRTTMFGTATSIAYRLAAQIKGSGVAVDRVADTRINPQSRFVEIGKAYGIPQLQGCLPISARGSRRSGAGLRVTLGPLAEGGAGPGLQHYAVDQFIVSGGWQPDLTLWHMTGGASRWDAMHHALVAEGTLAGTELAGSVAGFETAEACRKSGESAAAALFGQAKPAITEQTIAPIYESPDDPTPIAPPDPSTLSTSYLDWGASLARRPGAALQRRPAYPMKPVQGLGVSDVAAMVQLGLIATDEAGAIAQEQCVLPGDISRTGGPVGSLSPPVESDAAPTYLRGRFGATEIVRRVEAIDGRRFDIGCLIYANADDADPLSAVGVIFGPAGNSGSGGMALVGSGATTLQAIWVRDISGTIAARLIEDEAAIPDAGSIATGNPSKITTADGQSASG